MSTRRPKPDRRVTRTREALHRALIELIADKGYEALSVQDILDRADVGRSTFYAHFPGKSALLLSGFEELESELRAYTRSLARTPAGAPLRFHFSLPLLEHAEGHRRVFHAMVGRRSGFVVQTRMQRLVLDLVRDELAEFTPVRRAADTRREALAHFCAGGFYALLAWWIEGRTGLTASEVDEMFQQFCRRGAG